MLGYTESLLSRLITPDIQSMLAEKNYKELREALVELDPVDIAEVINTLDPEERTVVFRILPRHISADVFEHFQVSDQEDIIKSLGQEHVSAILNEMDPDDRTQMLEELPGKVTRRLLELLSPEERRIAVDLLGYPEESIGRLMTPEYLAIYQDWTVQQTLHFIRKSGREKETINILYVIDNKDRLLAYVKIRYLIFEEPDTLIRDIMNTQVIALNAFDDQETASDAMIRYDLPVLPVVDSDGALVGIVTSDDVFDVVVEEATEDMHKMGGVAALEEPYFHTSFLTLVQKRAGWLLVLLFGAMINISLLEHFDDIIQKLFVMTFFLPMVLSSGGNSGTQAATLVIRALAVQDISMGDWIRVFLRELSSGFILGILLGGTILLRVILLPPGGIDLSLFALTVTFSVTSVVVCGTLIGSMLPFLLRVLGFDPALSSTPLVSTLSDSIGVIIYYTTAIYILL